MKIRLEKSIGMGELTFNYVAEIESEHLAEHYLHEKVSEYLEKLISEDYRRKEREVS